MQNCHITTPWTVGLDADHYLSPELFNKFSLFSDASFEKTIKGIYFNRHNYFHGKRLKYGGYRNFYMLKMFRTGHGASDLNENMDHRFIVNGQKIIWKDGVLNEHNLKEDNIDFWIQKHIKYSTLVAHEEWERMEGLRSQINKKRFFGTPDERKAWMKNVWWQLPLFVRPFIYFIYRFIFLGGFLEHSGRENVSLSTIILVSHIGRLQNPKVESSKIIFSGLRKATPAINCDTRIMLCNPTVCKRYVT